MTRHTPPPPLDRELETLAPDHRQAVWQARIEAALFASAEPLSETHLQSLVGTTANVAKLVDRIQAELVTRPYEIAQTAQGWMFRTRPAYADAVRVSQQIDTKRPDFTGEEISVLAAIAYHQPIDRKGLHDIFGKQVSRDVLTRLKLRNLIASGPRAPRAGAPHTFVTTRDFLLTFDLRSLRDLPDPGGQSGAL